MNCLHYNSDSAIKYGIKRLKNGSILQTYLCKSCNKRFNERTGSPFEVLDLQKLTPQTKTSIDCLLTTPAPNENKVTTVDPAHQQGVSLHELKADPGRVGLESILAEVTKLQSLRQLSLPSDLFRAVSPKILQVYKTRVAASPPSELRSSPPATRYTLIAAFCGPWQLLVMEFSLTA